MKQLTVDKNPHPHRTFSLVLSKYLHVYSAGHHEALCTRMPGYKTGIIHYPVHLCKEISTRHALTWVLRRFSGVQLFETLWTIACGSPPSVGSSRQEYWSRLSCLPPGYLPDLRIKPASPVSSVLQADSLPAEPPGKPQSIHVLNTNNLARGEALNEE